MDGENGDEKPHENGVCPVTKRKINRDVYVWLVVRLLALFATVVATLVMGLNRESKTIVVAVIGTNPVLRTITAKFQDTPAFVFFVIVYAGASLYNLTALLLTLPGIKHTFKHIQLLITLSDMVMVGLMSAASAAAAAMAELGKKGNFHTRWNKICDRFEAYCGHGGGALMASFIGVGLLIALTASSITNLHKKQAAVCCT